MAVTVRVIVMVMGYDGDNDGDGYYGMAGSLDSNREALVIVIATALVLVMKV